MRCYNPDEITVAFDEERLVADAGLLLPATLAVGLGLRELLDGYVDLGQAPGRANVGDKAMTLVHSALAGGSWIDDCDRPAARRVHRAGARPSCCRALHDRHLPALVFMGPCPASWTPSAARRCSGPGKRGRARRTAC